MLKCVFSWTACPWGQHPLSSAATSAEQLQWLQGQRKAGFKWTLPCQKIRVRRAKIAACFSGQLSLMWGNIIYFLGSMPNPEGIRSLQCLSPERAKNCTVVDVLWWGFFVVICCYCGGVFFVCSVGFFLGILEGVNLWYDLARRLNCSTLEAAWSPGVGRTAWEVLPRKKLGIRIVGHPHCAMEELSIEGEHRLERKTMHQSYYSPNNTEQGYFMLPVKKKKNNYVWSVCLFTIGISNVC